MELPALLFGLKMPAQFGGHFSFPLTSNCDPNLKILSISCHVCAQEHQDLESSITMCPCVEAGPGPSPKDGPDSDHRGWVGPYHTRSLSGFLTSSQGGPPSLSLSQSKLASWVIHPAFLLVNTIQTQSAGTIHTKSLITSSFLHEAWNTLLKS